MVGIVTRGNGQALQNLIAAPVCALCRTSSSNLAPSAQIRACSFPPPIAASLVDNLAVSVISRAPFSVDWDRTPASWIWKLTNVVGVL